MSRIVKMPISAQSAETLALAALAFILTDDDRLMAFLGATGLGADEIRERAGEADFLAGVMDFLLADEALLLAFTEDQVIAPDLPLRLRRYLPGGAQMEF